MKAAQQDVAMQPDVEFSQCPDVECMSRPGFNASMYASELHLWWHQLSSSQPFPRIVKRIDYEASHGSFSAGSTENWTDPRACCGTDLEKFLGLNSMLEKAFGSRGAGLFSDPACLFVRSPPPLPLVPSSAPTPPHSVIQCRWQGRNQCW